MSLRDDVLPIINDGWSLAAEFWYTTYSFTVRTRTWSPAVGNGTATNSDLVIAPRPPVKELAAGRRFKVGPIIPEHGTGGYTPQQLNPGAFLAEGNTTVEIVHLLTGPDGVARACQIVDFDASDPGEYLLTLEIIDPREPL